MSKTTFTNGSIISPTFVNTLYVTSGGHQHDGVDADGHVSYIDLLTDTTNSLVQSAVNFLPVDSTCVLKGSDFVGGTAVSMYVHMQKVGGYVHATFSGSDENYGATGLSNSANIVIDFTQIKTSYPSYLPKDLAFIPCLFVNGFFLSKYVGTIVPGIFQYHDSPTAPIGVCQVSNTTSVDPSFNVGFFNTSNTHFKGIPNQTLTWKTV